MKTATYQPASKALLIAIRRLCKPLIKLCIEKGIGFPQLRDLCKEVYVEVAIEEFALENKTPSDSRVYLLTGVHRKDIKRLRSEISLHEEDISPLPTLSGEIVSHWSGLTEYQNDHGEPRCLTRSSKNKLPGFDDLVAGVSKDIRPRAILDEWIRLGTVTLNEDETICLNQAAFVPQKDLEEQAFYLGRNVHDHLAACSHNMLEDDDPMLERSVYFARLTEKSVMKLRKQASQQGMSLLQKLNRQALELQQADAGDANARYRMRFGCYWYEEKTRPQGKQNSENA